MRFEILSEISGIETVATASGICEIARLRNLYDRGRWRKRKGALLMLNRRMALFAWPRYTGMRHPESAAESSRSSICFETLAMTKAKHFVVCIDNVGYEASLEKRKIYVALRDPAAEKHDLLRVIDESGEDYLYPKTFFHEIELPQAARKAILAAA
jgi:hypothetical protein